MHQIHACFDMNKYGQRLDAPAKEKFAQSMRANKSDALSYSYPLRSSRGTATNQSKASDEVVHREALTPWLDGRPNARGVRAVRRRSSVPFIRSASPNVSGKAGHWRVKVWPSRGLWNNTSFKQHKSCRIHSIKTLTKDCGKSRPKDMQLN